MPDSAMNPQPLVRMIIGAWVSKTLDAATELNLFTKLSGKDGATVADVARETGIASRPADLLLTACASLGLLTKTGDRYANSPLAERYLVEGKPDDLTGFIRFMEYEFRAWQQLTDALRHNRPTSWNPELDEKAFEVLDPEVAQRWHDAMYPLSAYTAEALANAYDFSGVKRILDVGGGSGVFDIELCAKFPHLSATVYDVPVVCDVAARNVVERGLTGRIDVVPGDFLTDQELPRDHDLVLLTGVLHNWDAATGERILRLCHDALVPGGVVVICELFVNDERTGPVPAALMSMNMLVKTEGGQNYTATENQGWLARTGFTEIAFIPFSEPVRANGIVVGRKPA